MTFLYQISVTFQLIHSSVILAITYLLKVHSLAMHYYTDNCTQPPFFVIVCSKMHWVCSSNTDKKLDPYWFCLSGLPC